MPTDWLTLLAIFLGPVVAVIISTIISIRSQTRKHRLDAKENLFKTLMARRHISPPSYDSVDALNLIDVVFADTPQVVELWHNYYNAVNQQGANWTLVHYQYLDLLYEMAKSLNYKSVSQTDIARFYGPQAHVDFAELNMDIQKEWLRVLKETARFVVDKRDDEKPST